MLMTSYLLNVKVTYFKPEASIHFYSMTREEIKGQNRNKSKQHSEANTVGNKTLGSCQASASPLSNVTDKKFSKLKSLL